MNTEYIMFDGLGWRLTNAHWTPDTRTLRFDAVPAPEYNSPWHSPKEAKSVTNKVEKGQKYKHNTSGNVYEILSEPFESPRGNTLVAYWNPVSYSVHNADVERWEGDFTLIREPKFKVGDRVEFKYSPDGDVRTVEGVSQNPDVDGDFAYIVRDNDRQFELADEPALKAAE